MFRRWKATGLLLGGKNRYLPDTTSRLDSSRSHHNIGREKHDGNWTRIFTSGEDNPKLHDDAVFFPFCGFQSHGIICFFDQTQLQPHAFVVDNTNLTSVFVNPLGAGVLKTIRCIGVQERVLEGFVGCYALRRIELETKRHELNSFFLFVS